MAYVAILRSIATFLFPLFIISAYLSGCSLSSSHALMKDGNAPEHDMSSILVPVVNSSFEVSHPPDGTVRYFPWTIQVQGNSEVHRDKGYSGKAALVVNTRKSDDDDYDQISTNLTIPVQWLEGKTSFSVSAWIWSNKPLSSFLQVTSAQGKIATSDYHSGNGTWEFITVVYPFFAPSSSFKITLANKEGIAKFSDIRPLLLFDDRFENIPDACRPFREKVSYRKENRIRIVVVGN